MHASIRLCLMVFVVAAGLSGCGSRTDLAPAKSDQPVQNTQLLTDLPIPPNATMDNERSLILAENDHWLGRVVMRFWQSTGDLTQFYQNQMPGFGWEPVMAVTSSSSVLSFVRPGRAVTIQIEESSLGLKTQVSITVAPRQPLGAQPSSSGSQGYSQKNSSDLYPSQPQARSPVRTESLAPPTSGRP